MKRLIRLTMLLFAVTMFFAACSKKDEVAEGNEVSSDVTVANNAGYFERKEGKIYWTGAAQEECRSFVFEKVDF